MESCYHFNINSDLLMKLATMRANLQKERKMNLILRKKCRDLALLHCRQYLNILEPDSTILSLLQGDLQQTLSTPVQVRLNAGLNAEWRRSSSLMSRRSFNSPERPLCWNEGDEMAVDDGAQVNESLPIALFDEEIEGTSRRKTSHETIYPLRQCVTAKRQIDSNKCLEAIMAAGAFEPTRRHRPRREVDRSSSRNTNTDDNLVHGNESIACRGNNCPLQNQYWLRNRTVVIDFPSNSLVSEGIEEDHPQETLKGVRYTRGRQNVGSKKTQSEEGRRYNLSESQYWLRNRTVVFGNSVKIMSQGGLEENCPVEGRYRTGKSNNATVPGDTLPEMTFIHFQASDHSTPRQQHQR